VLQIGDSLATYSFSTKQLFYEYDKAPHTWIGVAAFNSAIRDSNIEATTIILIISICVKSCCYELNENVTLAAQCFCHLPLVAGLRASQLQAA
jgi:hypothetical protein